MSVVTLLASRLLVPVVVADDPDSAEPLADALVAGGLPVAEVTFRTAAAAEVIERMARRGDLLVGAGTVISPAQVDRAVDAGARFVVSPGLSRAVVERALERGVLPLPGVATASEIMSAVGLGLGVVKFFPAEVAGGVAAIRALAAPFAWLSFVPTGGIGPANLADYLAIPAVAAVGGSWMVPRDLVAAGDVQRLTDLVRAAVALATRCRPDQPS
jgi:2-dehydro-3-deoxyphosphogluconate aldolase/(4S)-4-hydroxy-2-oxoglutarate aldolase